MKVWCIRIRKAINFGAGVPYCACTPCTRVAVQRCRGADNENENVNVNVNV